jgi:ABC-type polysaccharide/polyol phosphate transport system ATPase subunit
VIPSSRPAASDAAVVLRGVSKRFRLHRGREVLTVTDLCVRGGRARLFGGEELWALRDVSLELPRGRMVGIIGGNGSGKSTLLKLIGGILKPTLGTVRVSGRVSALIELGAGFHPEFTGRENVYVNGILLGLTRAEVRERFDDIVAFAGLRAFIDNPVKTYSSGMYMRLGFAIAVTVDPDVLLIDEVLAVGDEAFQHQCVGRIQEFKARGKTIVLVSHDLAAVERLCDEAVWLDGGRLLARGGTREVIDRYRVAVARAEAAALTERHEVAQDAARGGSARRWGSREVEITSVRVEDAAGRERHLFHTGETARVILGYAAPAKVEQPVFGIKVTRADGVCCYASNTDIDGVDVPAVEGHGEVAIEFERLDLVEGEYLLDVAVHAKDYGRVYDYHCQLYPLAVRSATRDGGVFRPPHRWRL